MSFLAQCKRLLKPGGMLVLETGDTADLPSEQHHRPFYLPDHLSFANKEIVCDILIRCGFEIHNIKSFQSFTYVFDQKTWLKEIIKLAWPGKTSFFTDMIRKKVRSRNYVRDMYIVATLPAKKNSSSG